MPLQEFAIIAFFFAVALLGLLDHSPAELALIPDPLDVGGFPSICAAILLIALCLTVIRGMRDRRRGPAVSPAPLKKDALLMMALVGGYILAFAYIGFYVGTLLFCLASLFLLLKGEKPGYAGIAGYCIGTMAFWVVILKGFKLYLPPALLF